VVDLLRRNPYTLICTLHQVLLGRSNEGRCEEAYSTQIRRLEDNIKTYPTGLRARTGFNWLKIESSGEGDLFTRQRGFGFYRRTEFLCTLATINVY